MAQVPYDASQPFISAKIPDIGDISVINPPVAAKAPVLLIRKQKPIIHNLEHLIKVGVINETIAHLFRTGIAAYNNFLICGKSASIKSLLANAMMMEIPSEERVLMLDCQSELKQIHPHSVHLTGALEDFMRSDGTLRRNDFQQACSAIEANWILAGSMPLELLFFLVKKVSTERNGLIVTTQTMSAQEFLWSIEQGNVAHEINRSLEQIADTIDFIIEVGEQPCKEQRLLSILEVIDATGNQLVTQELFGYYPGTPSMQNDSVWRQVPKIKSSAKLRRRIRLENLRLSA
jgi:Flp pilus assembly CpaF family ATPase